MCVKANQLGHKSNWPQSRNTPEDPRADTGFHQFRMQNKCVTHSLGFTSKCNVVNGKSLRAAAETGLKRQKCHARNRSEHTQSSQSSHRDRQFPFDGRVVQDNSVTPPHNACTDINCGHLKCRHHYTRTGLSPFTDLIIEKWPAKSGHAFCCLAAAAYPAAKKSCLA